MHIQKCYSNYVNIHDYYSFPFHYLNIFSLSSFTPFSLFLRKLKEQNWSAVANNQLRLMYYWFYENAIWVEIWVSFESNCTLEILFRSSPQIWYTTHIWFGVGIDQFCIHTYILQILCEVYSTYVCVYTCIHIILRWIK